MKKLTLPLVAVFLFVAFYASTGCCTTINDLEARRDWPAPFSRSTLNESFLQHLTVFDLPVTSRQEAQLLVPEVYS